MFLVRVCAHIRFAATAAPLDLMTDHRMAFLLLFCAIDNAREALLLHAQVQCTHNVWFLFSLHGLPIEHKNFPHSFGPTNKPNFVSDRFGWARFVVVLGWNDESLMVPI